MPKKSLFWTFIPKMVPCNNSTLMTNKWLIWLDNTLTKKKMGHCSLTKSDIKDFFLDIFEAISKNSIKENSYGV